MDEDAILVIFLFLPCVTARLLWLFARHVRGQKVPVRWPQVLLGNALVLLLLLSVFLPASELYFRFVYDTTDSLGYTKVTERWMERHWHANALGARDNVEYSMAPEPGKRRVSFVGDSFTAGHGIKNVENRFGNLIRRAHPQWEVHLLAGLGLDTVGEIEKVQATLAAGYQLDEVVLVYCLNDIADIVPEWPAARDHMFDEVAQTGFFFRKSYFLNLLYHRFKVRQNPYMKDYYGFVREAYRGPLWEKQKEELKIFRDLVQSHGGRLSVVTFPFFHALGPSYDYQFVHDKLGQCWRELGVPHLDLLPIYRDLPPAKLTVNRLDPHPNEYANALAAAAIDKFLTALLAIPKPNVQTNSGSK